MILFSKIILFASLCLAASSTWAACPEEFLKIFSEQERGKFILCHEAADKTAVIALHRLDEYRIDLELYGKTDDNYQALILDVFKNVGDSLLEVTNNNHKSQSLLKDINNDLKEDFVFRVKFPRGASLFAVRAENNQLKYVQFFPTQETDGEPNSFLIHSENFPLKLAAKNTIVVVAENSYLGTIQQQEATYSLRANGVFYLSNIQLMKTVKK